MAVPFGGRRRGRCAEATFTLAPEKQMPHPSTRRPERPTLAAYAQPRLARSALDIATSVVPYLALSVLMYLTLGVSGLLDARAGAPDRRISRAHVRCLSRLRAWVSSAAPSAPTRTSAGSLGFLVLAPYQRWRHDHAVHHASSGDLERRGVGDVITLTVSEYHARSWRGRLAYRLIRNPFVMFGLGPILAMMVGPRIATRLTAAANAQQRAPAPIWRCWQSLAGSVR